MRKPFIFLSILFFFQGLVSQESEKVGVKPESKISKNGAFVKYYDDGTIKYSGQKNNGVRIGEWKDYYDNGKVSRIYSYTNGKRNIPQKKFYKSGAIDYAVTGNKEKSFSTRYYETGELFVERQIKTGNFKEYHKNGKLKVNSNYLNYYLSGLWTGFFDTGEKEWEVNYLQGYLNGIYKQFYKSGKIKVEGKYHNNKKQGQEKHFTEEGILDWVGVFDKGIPIKKWEKYNKEGKVVAVNSFKKGVLIKESKNFKTERVFVPNGIIFSSAIYPGCKNELGPLGKKKCMDLKIRDLFKHFYNRYQDFNPSDFSGVKEIILRFNVDKKGEVANIRVKADHKLLIKETKKIASYIPNMTPATRRGKNVSFSYRLPINYVNK